MRGLIAANNRCPSRSKTLPAYAGVDRGTTQKAAVASFPAYAGVYLRSMGSDYLRLEQSPHMRGFITLGESAGIHSSHIPACAGVHRHDRASRMAEQGIPHVCGVA